MYKRVHCFVLMVTTFKRFLIASGVVLAAFSSPALAEEKDKGFYATFGGGFDDIQKTGWGSTQSGTTYGGDSEVDPGFGGDVGLGYDFGKFRVEATYVVGGGILGDCEENVADTTCETGGSISTKSYMASGYYDIEIPDSKYTPYLGGGIGTTTVSWDEIKVGSTKYSVNDSDNIFTWQLKAGVSYAARDNVDVFAEGVYHKYSDFHSDTGVDGANYDFKNFSSLGARAGFRYHF